MPSNCVYHIEEKGMYQVRNKQIPEIEEDDANRGNAYYINKGFDEILVNFVKIKSSYNCYGTFFQSQLTLHKHFKKSYKIQGITT